MRRAMSAAGRARRALRGPDSIADLQAQVGALQTRWVAGTRSRRDRTRGVPRLLAVRRGRDHPVPRPACASQERVFVEFGVEDYAESNTRFLLVNDAWRGLIIDAGTAHRRFLEDSRARVAHTRSTQSRPSSIATTSTALFGMQASAERSVFSRSTSTATTTGCSTAIDCVSPQILVVEYNSLFGPERAVTIPYDAGFVRGQKHFSQLYWGASLAAMARAADAKGFALVGGNRAGNNAFFVRRDALGEIPERPRIRLLAAGAVP